MKDAAATLAILLRHVVDGAASRPDEGAGHHARHLAWRYAALAAFPTAEATIEAPASVQRCLSGDLNAAFDGVFAA